MLLGRKVMTNLDSIFKSRDITLPTQVHLIKALVFPVVMYGCESWTVNYLMFKLVFEKAEEPEIKLPTSAGSWKNKRIPETHLFLLY